MTYYSFDKRYRSFEAHEPRAFALSIFAHQFYENIVKSGGTGKIGSGYSHFVLHHFHTGKQKNPGGEKEVITIISNNKVKCKTAYWYNNENCIGKRYYNNKY